MTQSLLAALRRAFVISILTAGASVSAWAQAGFDRPGGDYTRFVVPSGDPAVCAARCEREGRCRAWAFSYPGTGGGTTAMCWLKSEVKPAVENQCCVSGIKGAGLVEKKSGPVEMSIDRFGGDYRQFDLPSDPTGEVLQEGLRGREPLPCLDLRAARLSRAQHLALLSQGSADQAAAQAMLHVGRGAVTALSTARRQRSSTNLSRRP